jgi:NADH-quinone oxidoreductase chain I
MFEYLREVVIGAKSLLVGMAITAKDGFSKTVTVHYPYEEIEITPNFRGHIDLVLNPKNGKHKCISCMMCQRACPSGCINIHAEKPEGAKKKQLVSYHLDFTKCSLCANCTEACPTSALEFSNEYNLVGTSRHDFHFELVGRLNARAEALGLVAEEVAVPEPPAKPDAGETQSPDSGE